MRIPRTTVSIALLAAAAAGGCSWRKDHLRESYAQSYDAAFTAQRQRAGTPAQPVAGLDSQEAAIISEGYRHSLAPKDVNVQAQPTVLIAPPGNAPPTQPLPPSVPKY